MRDILHFCSLKWVHGAYIPHVRISHRAQSIPYVHISLLVVLLVVVFPAWSGGSGTVGGIGLFISGLTIGHASCQLAALSCLAWTAAPAAHVSGLNRASRLHVRPPEDLVLNSPDKYTIIFIGSASTCLGNIYTQHLLFLHLFVWMRLTVHLHVRIIPRHIDAET